MLLALAYVAVLWFLLICLLVVVVGLLKEGMGNGK